MTSLTTRRRTSFGAIAAATALLLTGCTLGAGSGDDSPTDEEATSDDGAAQGGSGAESQGVLRVLTHDSFYLPDEVIEAFEEESGYTLEFQAPGDGGALVNQLILTKDAPLGDVVYGVDNSFASRGIGEGIFAPYTSPSLPDSAQEFLVDGDDELTPIDIGDVCLNLDAEWFADNDLPQPSELSDLTDPAYEDLVVVTSPLTSSPGLSFLLATVAEFGDEYADFWADLRDNGLLAVDSWSTAYYEEFSGSEGKGPRPIVLSYASSPAAEVGEDGSAPTAAMLGSCFRQVEYAGVIEGAENPEGAQAFIDFLLSEQVQAELPWSMFVYPVDEAIELPEEFTSAAPAATDPYELDPAQIDANREDWIQTWVDTVVE